MCFGSNLYMSLFRLKTRQGIAACIYPSIYTNVLGPTFNLLWWESKEKSLTVTCWVKKCTDLFFLYKLASPPVLEIILINIQLCNKMRIFVMCKNQLHLNKKFIDFRAWCQICGTYFIIFFNTNIFIVKTFSGRTHTPDGLHWNVIECFCC